MLSVRTCGLFLCRYLRPLVSYCSSWSSRTHTCGQLTPAHEGQRVKLFGWIQQLRLNKFLLLRDRFGVTQCMIPSDLWNNVKSTRLEGAIQVEGLVIKRTQDQVNPQMATGEVEVIVDRILSSSPLIYRTCPRADPTPPFYPNAKFNVAKEDIRAKFRYLALRDDALQRNLKIRSDLFFRLREYLHSRGFLDIETPTLFKRTPGGAREFPVATSFRGMYYALVQSPQQFKQLLMVGGVDRYYQIARCYRDESIRVDRQPEFTQLDLEMSFASKQSIIDLIEDLLVKVCDGFVDSKWMKTPFPRMSYAEAMKRFGVDKPDTRHKNELREISCPEAKRDISDALKMTMSSGRAPCAKFIQFDLGDNRSLTKSETTRLQDEAKQMIPVERKSECILTSFRTSEDNVLRSSLIKKCSEKTATTVSSQIFEDRDGKESLGFIAVGADDLITDVLGRLRQLLAARLLDLDPNEFRFLWIEDFPLFLASEDGGIESAHHPFTQPVPDDAHMLESDPLSVRSLHYDLVINGKEVGGGSIRIHHAELQKTVLEKVLKVDASELQHLLEALQMGCPPHGGIALGLDRIVALLCRVESIKDVIAFPKGAQGKDLMSGAPTALSASDMEYYGLRIDDKPSLS